MCCFCECDSMCVWACVLSSFTWYGGRDMNTALKHNITAFLWQMSSAAVLAGPQVHAQNSHTHKRKRKVFHCIYIRIEKATTFPGCCRPFSRSRVPRTSYGDSYPLFRWNWRNSLIKRFLSSTYISGSLFNNLAMFWPFASFLYITRTLHCTALIVILQVLIFTPFLFRTTSSTLR